MKLNPLNMAVSALLFSSYPVIAAPPQPELSLHEATLLTVDGLKFKDLNHSGKLEPYEDWRLLPEERAADLVKRMTLQEKAGVMMHGSAPTANSPIGAGTHYDIDAAKKMIADAKVNTLITRLSADDPAVIAEENNKLQQIAEGTRLGIPVTISSDPRNSFEYLIGASLSSGKFTKWPETLGLAAIGDEQLTRRYADIVRQEYLAVGIREALSPQADLATEPRWARISGTFGEDPTRVHNMVRGYIEGMQNGTDGLVQGSVIAVVKHWVGYGAAENGYDSHNVYGKNAIFSGNNLKEHIYPFTGAFEANVASVMPTYSILKNASIGGKPLEPVGAGFSHQLLTDILRGQYGFKGVILSDWLITNDCNSDCINGVPEGKEPVPGGMSWGVENLTPQQRFVKAVNAGVDQFGGVTDSQLLVNAVNEKQLTQQRLDESVVRILEQKFRTGLFENPFVDPQKALHTVGRADWQKEANAAQGRSLVLLQNKEGVLPLKRGKKIWLYGIEPKAAQIAGFRVVDSPEKADVALIRAHAPYEQPHKQWFFGRRHHEGSLAFTDDNPDYQAIVKASHAVPTVVTVYLDRPAILSNVKDKAKVVIGNFGVSDAVLFTRLTSSEAFTGKLPFELPSSMNAVLEQQSDVPHDSQSPLFEIGFGLAR
ncbi:glycoside hydrolase family 3 protein [Serratia plymuthica]|uniref:beta-glucosidase n=1 Tax=Serratia plymuthica TaxID=82996 RepID=A0A7T2SXG1_SERPL|nr:glycoside hydrolase family 3 N-terminal domain-containing protein [Serratia plymuthica]QPS23272.1 glycoside hydrolase family 3 protein [Serratia plymuthica]QPS65500.1 glycoside hydrolase family 3 protein [Serratia plymuthica]RKS64156.1 beta-glucosidase [Serratia plymuthica]CAI2439771.1 Periplasmic beta-glucosidase precursor [Serratia plymuthica]